MKNLDELEEELEILKYYGCGKKTISGCKCTGRGVKCKECKNKIKELELEIKSRQDEKNLAVNKIHEWNNSLNPINIPDYELFRLISMIEN